MKVFHAKCLINFLTIFLTWCCSKNTDPVLGTELNSLSRNGREEAGE